MQKLAKAALFAIICAASGIAIYFSYVRQQRLRCEATSESAETKFSACQASCNHGDANHCLWVARQVDKSEPTRAASLYRRACDAAIVPGCVGIAHLMLEGRGINKDVVGANRLLATACDDGNAIACGSLGLSYAEGIGTAKDIQKAVALYQKACDGNDALGCYNLAQLYNSDRLGNLAAKSAPLYKRACDASEMLACSMLGALYREGRGVDKDYSAAETLLSNACDHGETSFGCGELAMLYNHGWGVIRDLHRAKNLYKRSCDVGNSISCDHLANLLADDGEFEKALAIRKKSCDQGGLSNCGSLAQMYLDGVGVSKDVASGVALYQRACDGGDSDSCNTFGIAYQYGKGVALDTGKAAELYDKACKMNSQVACSNLGRLYVAGDGVPKNVQRGLELYEAACSARDLDACNDAGLVYEFGTGIKQDIAKAVAMYKKSCDGDNAAGCSGYAAMFSSGKGVPKDIYKARLLNEKACAGDDPRGCANAAILWRSEDMQKWAAFDAKACKLGQEASCTPQARAVMAASDSSSLIPTSNSISPDTSRRAFKVAVACLASNEIPTKSSRMPASNGTVAVFDFSAASKTVLLMELDHRDILNGAVMIVQPGGGLANAVTVFSMLGGCLTGVDRKQVTLALLRPGLSSLGGAYFLHKDGGVQKLSVAWTVEDVRKLAR